jgi:hypothetical protein
MRSTTSSILKAVFWVWGLHHEYEEQILNVDISDQKLDHVEETNFEIEQYV